MRKTIRIILISLMSFIGLLAVAACSKDVSGISIQDGDLPRQVYVAGQDLDLSDGTLTVSYEGETEEIPLSSSDVTVTGYDKNQIGTQELTVSYAGFETAFSVTVYSRITVVGPVTDYLIGDSFDNSKGTLTITEDDGSRYSVSMSSEYVTVENFNSSAAASSLTVDVSYRTDSVDYSGSFEVSIYEIESMTISKPTKLVYRTHDSGLELSGGYLIVKANGGQITRYIEMSEDMISGFDLSAATTENRTADTEYLQTLTVTYLGFSDTFSIAIIFSDVSYIQWVAAQLASLDWLGDAVPAVTEEQGVLALEAAQLYLGLSASDKKYIADDVLLSVVRAAAVYGYAQWEEKITSDYGDLFAVGDGELTLADVDYQTMKSAYQAFQDGEDELYDLADDLNDLKDEFSDFIVYGSVTVSDYMSSVCDKYDVEDLSFQAAYALSLYETMLDIGSDWEGNLSSYETAVKAALNMILQSSYKSSSYSFIYDLVETWRGESFEVLYVYCWNNDNLTAIQTLFACAVIDPFETMYSYLINTYYQYYLLYYGYSVDTSLYLLYYEKSVEWAETIRTSQNAMYRGLYGYYTVSIGSSAYTIDSLLYTFHSVAYGFHYASVGNSDYFSLWEAYLEIYENYRWTDGYYESAEYGEDLERLFNAFVEASPTTQYAFIAAMNSLYESYGVPSLALDYSSGTVYTYFTYFIATYYGSKLSDSGEQIFAYLLIALEYYARLYTDSNALPYFVYLMSDVTLLYEDLSADDKANFDTYAGGLYAKYLAIYQRYDANGNDITSVSLGEWADEFEALAESISDAYTAYYYTYCGYYVYPALFSAFETAQSIAGNIIDNAPAEIVDYYYYKPYSITLLSTTYTSMSLDYLMGVVRSAYGYYLTGLSLTIGSDQYLVLDWYEEYDMGGFCLDAHELIWALVDVFFTMDGTAEFSENLNVKAIMESFRSLNLNAQWLYYQLDGNYSLYYNALLKYFSGVLTDSEYALVDDLLNAEYYYVLYAFYDSIGYSTAETYLKYFQTAMKGLVEGYDALGDDKANFDSYLSDTYKYYLSLYTDLTPAD